MRADLQSKASGFAAIIVAGSLFLSVLALSPGPAIAQSDDASLAKQLANPIASLISVPFQNNYDCCYGPNNAGRYTLNIQPVIPFKLNEEWNLITRTILPIISQGSPAPGVSSSTGLGDTVQSFFFSPSQVAGGVTWGIGPVFLWPTGNATFGSGKYGAGPTAVILKQEHGWTYGALANHVWSYAGDSLRPEVNSTFLQPFISYAFPDTTSITLNTDLIFSVSRDGGTAYSAFTMAKKFTADAIAVYESDSLDISGQPSGTSIKWQVVSANGKMFELHDIYLYWS